MSEADDDNSDLRQYAMCWRALRKLMDGAAERIELPDADRLLICHETLQGLYQLTADDAERDLNRTFAALQQLPQLQREHHRERDARKIANRSPMVLTLVMAALAEGRERRWPHLFPEQKSPQGGQIDGEYAVERGYLAALLEWLDSWGSLALSPRLQARSKATGDNISPMSF